MPNTERLDTLRKLAESIDCCEVGTINGAQDRHAIGKITDARVAELATAGCTLCVECGNLCHEA
jgi:hypothetical protein